ncbi:hypothetical protein Dimus_002651 [Dionaea muscipula]
MDMVKLPESNGVGRVAVSSGGVGDNEDVEGGILEDFDSYCQDINDRFTISRMVGDIVMKGTVKEVFEAAAGMVAGKELQVAQLNEEQRLQRLACDELSASNVVLCDREIGHEIQKEVELVVIRNCICRFQVGSERRLAGEQDTDDSWIERFKEISALRQELDVIRKSLSSPEFAHFGLQCAAEMDSLHRKGLISHLSAPSSLLEGKGKLEDPKVNTLEKFESSQLKHMSLPELYNHYRVDMAKLKREHELAVERKTEEIYKLKREFLNERDILKKKIGAVILKLEHILSVFENLPESFDVYGNKLYSILSENRSLKDTLDNKEKEIEHLSSKFSDVADKLSKENLDKLVWDDIRNEIDDDVHIEATLREEVYQIILKGLVSVFLAEDEDADMKYAITQGVLALIYDEAIAKAKSSLKHEFQDVSDADSLIKEGLSGFVFHEVLKDMTIELQTLQMKSLQADDCYRLLESKVSEMEKALELKDQENQKLKHEITELRILADGKGKLVLDLEAALEKLRRLSNRNTEQEALIFERNKELEALKTRLEFHSSQINSYEEEVSNLTKKLDQEAATVLALSEEKQSILSLFGVKDKEQRKHLQSLVPPIKELSKAFDDFELRIAENIGKNNLRLESSNLEVNSFIKKANILRRTGSLYKLRLEKRCMDLQKAEAEVDLLGDEVDSLLGLLQKVYMGLDHYSPILQHYPGMMEILKLVERELCRES